MAIGPVSNSQPFNVVPSAYQEGDVMAGFKQNNEEQKAIAFQKWLAKGVEGMNVVYSELPDEVKRSVVDPAQLSGFMGKPEGQDMYLNWYKSVNAAISKQNINTAAQSGNYQDVLKYKASAPDATAQDSENLYSNQKIGEFFKGYNPKVEEARPDKSYDVIPKDIKGIFESIESGGRPGVFHPKMVDDESYLSKMKRGNIALGRRGVIGKWFSKIGLPEPSKEEFAALEAMEKSKPGSVEEALSNKDINSLPQHIKDSLPKSYIDFLTSDELQNKAVDEVLKEYIKQSTKSDGEIDYRELAMRYFTGGINPDAAGATRNGKPYTAKMYADDFMDRLDKAGLNPNFIPYELVEKEAKKAWRNKTRGEHLTEAYKFDQSPGFLQAMEKYAQALPMDKVFDPNSDAKLAMAKSKMDAKSAKDSADMEFKKKKLAFEAMGKYVKTADEAIQKAHIIKPVLEYIESEKEIPGIGALKKPFRDLITMSEEEFAKLTGDKATLDRVSKFRTKLNIAFSSFLRLSGGKTITDNELESLEKDFGLSKTNTQEDFKNAVRYLYDINQKRAESTWDTFGKFTDGITPEGTIKPPEKIGEVDKASKEVKAQKEMTKQDKFLALMEAALSKRDSTKSGR